MSHFTNYEPFFPLIVLRIDWFWNSFASRLYIEILVVMKVNSLIKILELKSESTLKTWNDALHVNLNLIQIKHYIFRNVSQSNDAAERLQWRKNKFFAVYLITSSINSVRQILKNNDWTINEKNSKTLYDIINTIISQLIQKSIKILIKQLNIIKRQNYISMNTFIKKFIYLHRRMKKMHMKLSLKF